MKALRDLAAGVRSGVAALLVCGALAAWQGLAALRPSPLPVGPAVGHPAAASSVGPAPVVPDSFVLQAVRRNPLRPDRRRAQGRFHPELPESPEIPGRPAPDLRITGIARSTNGGQAVLIVQAGGAGRLLRAGNDIDGFTIRSIGPAGVRVTSSDTALVLPLPPTPTAGGLP